MSFGDFLVVRALCENLHPSCTKSYFLRFWGSHFHTFSDFFQLLIPVVFVNVFLTILVDFWVPQGPQMGHFGVLLGPNLVTVRLPLPVWVPRSPQGGPKGHF